ncbi:calcium-dependent serine proteinase-like [Pristis pectinata]|uniref:calcium-dependent serine proteinase-like n=1 Tax=Pristis pectinata TaxID=685728 RepID=UPI00223CAE34|nr:calcium-dependent serine proteinase-like [Pristis pectinata]
MRVTIFTLVITASQAIHLDQSFGQFSSPNHPLGYPALSNQTWDISAPKGYIIKVYIPYLDIEFSDGCQSSYVEVLSEEGQLARLCGRREGEKDDPALHEYYSSTNSMRVSFRANSSGTRPFSGFMALYSRVDVNECELGSHGCSHYCANTIGGHRCYCPMGLKLQTDSRTCKKQDVVCSGLAPADSIVTPLWREFQANDRVKVTCEPGYEIVEGFKTIPHYFVECQQDGTWSTSRFKCQAVDCASPPDIENGRFVFLTGSGVTTYKSLIQYQCNEPYYEMDPDSHRDFACTEVGTWENNGTGQVLPHCSPVCGRPSHPVTFRQRILKGSVAQRGNFPWQVLFRQVKGAGALLSDRWVLTAAHVVQDWQDTNLLAGVTNLKQLSHARALQADRVFVHPGYKQPGLASEGHNYNHDIALVRLRTPVTMGPDVSPICLPKQDGLHQLRVRQLGLVSGWGVTENNTLPTNLMFTRLPVRDLEECRASVAQHLVTVTDNMICAGDEEGSDSCQGDSGGAYVFPYPKPRDNRFFIGGIVSWGVKCGTVGFYTKVGNYLEWIEGIVQNKALLVLSAFSHPKLWSDATGLFGEIHLSNYQPEESLSWEVGVPPGFGLKLQLQHYDSVVSSSCGHNYVEVYADRERLGRFCGNVTSSRFHRPSSPLTASDQHAIKLRVRCRSSDRESRRGFSVFYEAVDIDECGLRWEGQAPCQHFCHNYIGGYRCYCRQGYSLHGDGKTCKVTQCDAPEEIDNGSYEYLDSEAGTQVGSAIRYNCHQRYYTMTGGADGTYSCRANGKWMNIAVGEALPTCTPVCGKPQEPPLLVQRIFGGAAARDGNFPWQVYFESSVCGGALVSDSWVLTSASCVGSERRPLMFGGATDRGSLAGWTRLEAAEVHVHPGYTRSPAGHDIALVRLRGKVGMGPALAPVCLPGRQPRYRAEVGTVGYVSGFGETERFSQSDVLMFAPVPVVERDKCQRGSDVPLSQGEICAGSGAGVDACTGDGGGSLVFRDPFLPDTFFTGGIVSRGSKCGEYGVYTNVPHHLDWIQSVMES